MGREIDLLSAMKFCSSHKIDFNLSSEGGINYVNYETKPKRRLSVNVGNVDTEEGITELSELLEEKLIELKEFLH
jgi:hypothetical protein